MMQRTVHINRLALCRVVAAVMAAWILGLTNPVDVQAQNRTHTVYYEGTDHELHVYRIWGKNPGKRFS